MTYTYVSDICFIITFQLYDFTIYFSSMVSHYVSVLYFPNKCQVRFSFIFSKWVPITFQFYIFQMNANYVSVLYFPNECQLRFSFIYSKWMPITFQFYIFTLHFNSNFQVHFSYMVDVPCIHSPVEHNTTCTFDLSIS